MAEDNAMNPKVSGYLEKKSKMKMMNSYKRYWFVLEGRLLLYYRSKDEYEAISPCKGSINLGPACNIKTCPSTSGVYVFQIETRTSTTTLRADNREDQNRWMQGIMSALNQNKNAKKLSHFRYSLDELSQQAPNKNALRRKNTIPPQSDSSKNESDNDKGIIRRLQKIGAHSYGGSMGAINQIESKSQKASSSTETENLSSFKSSVSVENNQYGMIKKNTNSENTEIRKGPRLNENIYERISGDSSISINSKEVNYCIRDQTNINYNETSAINTKIMSCDTENNSRPTTFLLENETYGGIPLNSENNDSQNRIRQTSFILENNQYCDIEKIIKFPDSEVIYAEPKCSSATDHNKNNLTLNKIKGEENAYSIIKLYDSEKNTVNSQYEDTKKCGDYLEAKYQSKKNTKLKKHKSKNQSKTIISENKKEFKLKKSSSFINRVWRKKKKHTEELYENIPDSPADKIGFTDDVAVQMLSELQNLLENKMPLLLEQCSKPQNDNPINEGLCRSASENTLMDNPHMDNAATVQMLTELHNILKDKKPILCVSTNFDLINR
ncbi:putative leucine-rich repeat-containing protein DDB_G0290503 [Anoplophora glabripennis]|uniref:putative leucine-rich repeat-containing protein DDB_G0290503 n=1 Tax=Anoplophora glabripennis TaxID=217634 RepID=UPI0008735B6D|nr:putative leucine-rich repeat-containing protein DDB_G0290503 [Anoplophora glabripennis]